jgi:hypothetical protein
LKDLAMPPLTGLQSKKLNDTTRDTLSILGGVHSFFSFLAQEQKEKNWFQKIKCSSKHKKT